MTPRRQLAANRTYKDTQTFGRVSGRVTGEGPVELRSRTIAYADVGPITGGRVIDREQRLPRQTPTTVKPVDPILSNTIAVLLRSPAELTKVAPTLPQDYKAADDL